MKEFKEQIIEKIIEAAQEQKIVRLKEIAAYLGIRHITRQDTADIQKAVGQRLDGYHSVQLFDNPHSSLFQSLAWIQDDVEFHDAPAVEKSESFREWLIASKMTQSGCARRFGIPLRTVQHWANGTRAIPEYVFRMMRQLAAR